MSNKCNIIKISSQYCLKSIFSYIEYNKVLKIVKYNKRIQKKLELEDHIIKNIQNIIN